MWMHIFCNLLLYKMMILTRLCVTSEVPTNKHTNTIIHKYNNTLIHGCNYRAICYYIRQ